MTSPTPTPPRPRFIVEVEDTAGLWPRVAKDVAALSPLRDFVLTNKFGNAIDVGDLDVRFVLATDPSIARQRAAAAGVAHAPPASNHPHHPPPTTRGGPATWFRAPLAALVLVGGDDADEYKRLGVVRAAVRAVADRVAAGGGTGAPGDWALLYVPPPPPPRGDAATSEKAAARLFAALRADWSTRRHDRCVRLDGGHAWAGALGALLAGAARASLEARRRAYESAAAAASLSAAAAAAPSFAPLFLAKDSLATLLEAAGAGDEALRERGELEALYLAHVAGATGSGGGGPPAPPPPGADAAALVSASWRATRRAGLAPGGPPDLFFRQALFAGQARLLLAGGRPAEAAAAGARFVASLTAGLAARRAAGAGVPPLFPEAWSVSACIALVNALAPALADRCAPGLVVAAGGGGGGGGGLPSPPALSWRPSEDFGPGGADHAPAAPPAQPAFGPATGWGLALGSWLDDPAARAAAAATAAGGGSGGADAATTTRALCTRAGDLASAARDAWARLALACVPGAAEAGVRARDDRLAGLAPSPLAAATPSPAKRRGGGGGGGGGGVAGTGGVGGDGHLVATAAAPGLPPSEASTGSAPGTPRSRASRLGPGGGSGGEAEVALQTLPPTPAGKIQAPDAAVPAPPAAKLATAASSGSGSGRRLLQRAPELLRVRAAAAAGGGAAVAPLEGGSVSGSSTAGGVAPAPAPPPSEPALDPAVAEAAAESDAESGAGSPPGTPTRGAAGRRAGGSGGPATTTTPPTTPGGGGGPSPPAWVSDPRLVAGLASPEAAASLWLALTGVAVAAYAAAGRARRAAALAASAAPALCAAGDAAGAAAALTAHAASATADGWPSLTGALLASAADAARAGGGRGPGVRPADAVAVLALPPGAVGAAARESAQGDLEAAAAASAGAAAGPDGEAPAEPVWAGGAVLLAPAPGAASRLAVGARAPSGAAGRGDALRPPPPRAGGGGGGGGGAAAGSVGTPASVTATLVSALPRPLACAAVTLRLAILQEVAVADDDEDDGGGGGGGGGAGGGGTAGAAAAPARFRSAWRETEAVDVPATPADGSPTITLAPGVATPLTATLTPLTRGLYALRGAVLRLEGRGRVRLEVGVGPGGRGGWPPLSADAAAWPGPAGGAHEAVVLVAGPAAPVASLAAHCGGDGAAALVAGVGQWVGVDVGGRHVAHVAPPGPALHLAPAPPSPPRGPEGDAGDAPVRVGLALAPGAPLRVGAVTAAATPSPSLGAPWLLAPAPVAPAGDGRAADAPTPPTTTVWVWASPGVPPPPRLTVPVEPAPRTGGGRRASAAVAHPRPARRAAAAAPPSPRRAAAAAAAAALVAAPLEKEGAAAAHAVATAPLACGRGVAAMDALLEVGGGGGGDASAGAAATPPAHHRTHAARLLFPVSPPLDVGLRVRRVAGGGPVSPGASVVVEVSARARDGLPWPVRVTEVRLVAGGGGGGGGGGGEGEEGVSAPAPPAPPAAALALAAPLSPAPPLTLAPGAVAHFLSTATHNAGAGGGGGWVEVGWEAATGGTSGGRLPPPPAGAPSPAGTVRVGYDLVLPPPSADDEDDEDEGGDGGGGGGCRASPAGGAGAGAAPPPDPARTPIAVRFLGPFAAAAGAPTTLCWRLERGARALPPGVPPVVRFELAAPAGWGPPSRLAGAARVPPTPGAAATVEAAWTPPGPPGPLRAPTLTITAGGVGRDAAGGGAGGLAAAAVVHVKE